MDITTLMVNVNHPIILEVKGIYRSVRDIYEGFTFDVPRFAVDRDEWWTKKADDLTVKLSQAKSGIEACVEKLKAAEDLPAEQRGEYIWFINGHTANVDTWLQNIQRTLKETEKGRKELG